MSDVEEWALYVKRVGLILQKARLAKGYSQERVAYDAGLSKVQYQRLENGGFAGDPPSNPTIRTLMAVCQILGVRPDDVLPEPWPDLHAR